MQGSSRIVVNTAAQYVKTIANVLLSMYSVRLVLELLGDSDYGIYSLVAGVVALLSFVSNALVVSTQRFLSFHQGVGDLGKLKSIFEDSVRLHLYIGAALLLLLFPLVFFLFNGFLEVPVDRIPAAKFVYLTVLAVLFITFVTAPFRASLVSHEDIVYISVVDVIDGVLKVVLVIVLAHLSVDHLKGYAVSLLSIQMFNLLALSLFALIRYPECSLPRGFGLSAEFVRDLSAFAGWTIFSTGCIVGRTQGCAIILNKAFGVVVNSAYGIAQQISGYVRFVSESLLNAMRPQIMKAEGNGDRQRMLSLSCKASKYAFLLLSMVVIPVCFYVEPLLHVWLREAPVPEGTPFFCRMVMIVCLADSITIGLGSANQAIGKIRNYSLAVNSTKILTLPLVIVCLKLKLGLYSVAVCYVGVELVCALIRLPLLKSTAGLDVRNFLSSVLHPLVIPLVLFVASLYLFHTVLGWGFIWSCLVCLPVYVLVIYFLALDSAEKSFVKSYLGRIRCK